MFKYCWIMLDLREIVSEGSSSFEHLLTNLKHVHNVHNVHNVHYFLFNLDLQL